MHRIALGDSQGIKHSRCYLAGPMRSKPEFNYPAFYVAAFDLRAAGWSVFNPAEQDVLFDDQPRDFLEMDQEDQEAHAGNPANARRYAYRDLDAILALRAEEADALVVLPDWEDSLGARAEVAVAQWVGLQVIPLAQAIVVGRMRRELAE